MDYQDWYSTFVEAPRKVEKEPIKCKTCGAVIRISFSTKKFCKC